MDITLFPGELLWCMCGLGTRLQLEDWTAVPHIVMNMCSTQCNAQQNFYKYERVRITKVRISEVQITDFLVFVLLGVPHYMCHVYNVPHICICVTCTMSPRPQSAHLRCYYMPC